MTSIMRRTVRGAAAGAGALAIIAGTAACGGLLGGGDVSDEGDDPAVEETEEDPDAGAEGDSEASEDDSESQEGTETGEGSEAEEGSETEEGDDAAGDDAEESDASEGGEDAASGEPLSEEDLEAAAERYYEFLEAAATTDGEAACGMIAHPATGNPLEGKDLSDCAGGFESKAGEVGLDPSLLDAIDPSMIEGVDNGDGTAGASLMGSDAGVTFIKGDDGAWYIDGSDYI
ncbi:hypothetical protein [Brachybacterium sp.]|uniref:hypothetical protein n=1 Tax=Brachybacterium sp. TaxID=1891286 RepID=UPI002ED0CE2D